MRGFGRRGGARAFLIIGTRTFVPRGRGGGGKGGGGGEGKGLGM